MNRSSRPKNRNILKAFAEFDPSEAGDSPLIICSLSVSASSDDSETRIYAGTLTGSILLLSVQYPPSDRPAGVEVVRSTSVGRSAVEEIQNFTEISRLVALSEGFLFLLDVLLLQSIQKLEVSGATAIARRLVCSELASADPLGRVNLKSESFVSGQRLFQRFGGGNRANGLRSRAHGERKREEVHCFLAVAAGRKLKLLELSLQDGVSVSSKEILGVEGVRTIAWLDDSVIVGTLDGYLLFSTETGQSTPLFSLPEFSGPPQLRPLFKSKEALLFVDNVGVVVNSFGQPVGGSLVFQQVPESIADFPPYVFASGDGWVDFFRKSTGVCVQSTSYPKSNGRSCLVSCDDMGSGQFVVVATPFKIKCFQIISAEEQIKDLLRQKYFKEAISLVEECESEGEMSKEMLSFVHAQVGFLLLFDLHFEDAVKHFLLSDTMQPSEIFPFIMQDPNRWSALVPRNRYWGLHPPPTLLENVVDQGLAAIHRAVYLRKAGIDTTIEEDFLLNPPSKVHLLESAIENIIRYFLICRSKELSPFVREGVDTLLIYLYRALNRVDDMEELASSSNSCVVEALETLLEDSGHSRTLALLYASKGMDSKALVIWRKLAKTHSSRATDSALEASKILEKSSDQHLILKHLGWISDENADLAVKILSSERRSHQPSPEEVLAAIDPRKYEIGQRYLQWLIEDQDCDDPHLHTLYALSLAKSVVGIDEIGGKILTPGLSRNSVEDAGVEALRERLQLFLHGSDLYDAEQVLFVIEGSELWLEKAILYRKLGHENLVLQILALKLEDSEAAEQYCVEIGRPDAFMQLLKLYLDPQNGKEPMFKAAVRLLHKHGESLDPLQVLERLSPDMPLHLASETIKRMLRARVHHHRQGQIVSKLCHAVKVEAELARLEEMSRHVQISDESICNSCRTRLGTKLFAIYPDDSVVCYKCYRKLGESTSATGRDFREDRIFKPGWLVNRR
ncbi:vacuolar sorting protein 39 [Wolffia australiana]